MAAWFALTWLMAMLQAHDVDVRVEPRGLPWWQQLLIAFDRDEIENALQEAA